MSGFAARVGIGLAGLVMVGVLVLVVSRVAGYGSGGTATILRRCPRNQPGESGSTTPGAAGETVTIGPTAALVCRWRQPRPGQPERAEAVVRGAALAGLVSALNELPPVVEFTGEVAGAEPEAGYGCESGTQLVFLVGLRYDGDSEVRVVAHYAGCGYVINLADGTAYVPTGFLRSALNELLAEGSISGRNDRNLREFR